MKAYLRKHELGIKYFGVSVDEKKRHYGKNQESTYWQKYLKDNGYKFETEVLFEHDDIEVVSAWCIEYSKANRIWDNPEYANRMLEDAKPGCPSSEYWHPDTIKKNKAVNIGRVHKPEDDKKRSDAMLGSLNHFYGKHHTDESKYKQSQTDRSYMTGENNWMYGKEVTVDTRQHLRVKNGHPIEVDGVGYDSIRHAEAEINVSRQTIRNRLKNGNFPGYVKL